MRLEATFEAWKWFLNKMYWIKKLGNLQISFISLRSLHPIAEIGDSANYFYLAPLASLPPLRKI